MTAKKDQKDDNDWGAYQKLVLDKQAQHDKKFDEVACLIKGMSENFYNLKIETSSNMAGIKASLENIRKDETTIKENTSNIVTLKTDVAQLQVKSGIWGALGGMLGFVLLVFGVWAKSGFENVMVFFKK